MPRTLLEHRYFDRMASGLGDKLQILDLLTSGTVADIGAGGGELASAMAQLEHIDDVYAIDDSADSLRRLREIDSISALHGSFERLYDIGGPLDNVVLCSVMHEVWSYGGSTDAERWNAWHAAIEISVKALEIGGRLIIRDGVMPSGEVTQGMCTLVAPDGTGDANMMRYAMLTPFLDAVPERTGFREYYGEATVLAEALLTVNWGKDSLPRESQERNMLLDLDGYAHAVAKGRALRLIEHRAYTQPEYLGHLAGWKLMDANGAAWFPETNALWVFEKTA
jgi:SAM-dependent methyltransferase